MIYILARRSSVGSLQFRGKKKVTLADCPSQDGCLCHNSHPQVLPHICSYVSEQDCASQTAEICSDPVRPVGSCCGVCGAVGRAKMAASMRSSWAASWAKVENIRKSALAKYEHLQAYAGVTHDGELQLVAVDSEGRKQNPNPCMNLCSVTNSRI
jgi:hypothetical protein